MKDRKTIPPDEIAMFCDQIAMILHSGLYLADGMDALRDAYHGSRYALRFEEMAAAVHGTGRLYDAVNASALFPDYLVEMVKIGEQSGMLEENMKALSSYYHSEAQVRQDIKNAVMYPLLLMFVMLALLCVLAIFVFPIFSEIIGGTAERSSMTALHVGRVVGVIAFALMAALILITLVIAVLLKTGRRDAVLRFLMAVFPQFKILTRELSMSRFSMVLGKLLMSGYPISEAMTFTQKVLVDSDTLHLVKKCQEQMEQGVSASSAMEQNHLFSGIQLKMLKVGEATGQLDKTLESIGEMLREDNEIRINRLAGLVEPVLVSILAVILGALLLSVMLPLIGVLTSV